MPDDASLPEISIIVPHLNQPDYLETFLAALFAPGTDMSRAEVIVVDNGSTTLPRAVTGRYPGVQLVEEPVPGPGPARNRGATLARGALLAFTDADCRPDPGWLAAIRARFAADAGLAVIGGDIRVFSEDPGQPTLAETYECVYAFRQRLYIERQGYSVTANLAMRRTTFNAVGPFGGIGIAEDNDWGTRAGRLGYRTIYAPEVIVHHPARRTMAELYTKWGRLISHHYATQAQGLGGRARWFAKSLAMALSPLAEVPRILSTDRLGSPRDRRRALRAVAQVRLYRARRMLAVMFLPSARGGSVAWNRP